MYDPNSLMYVTKEYENSLKEKAKKIYADNTVKTTLDSVNKELDDILLQINNKLDQISQKNDEINLYKADVHRYIDSTSIETKDMIDDSLASTITHPSVISNKANRNVSKLFNNKNFINQKIELNGFDKIDIEKDRLGTDDNVKSFDIPISDKETLKVIDYSITYKQKPTIVKKVVDSEITEEEKTVIINRIFTGRFYIIRPDVDNHPEQIIVKMVVENADNTANNKETAILNIREMKDTDNSYFSDNIGPEFDLYFFTHDVNKITICIGDISPFKWILQKSSFTINEDEEPDVVEIIVGNVDKVVTGIDFSKNLNGYFIKTTEKLYFTKDPYFGDSNYTVLSSIEYDGSNFWVEDISGITFIHSKDKTYVCGTEISSIKDTGVNVSSIKQTSSSEIIGIIDGIGLIGFDTQTSQFDTNPFATLNGEVYDSNTTYESDTYTSGGDFVEIDKNKLLVVSTKADNFQYFFITLNQNTNSYIDGSSISNVVSINISNFLLTTPISSKLQILKTVVGVFVLVKSIGEESQYSVIYNLRNLNIKSKDYVYQSVTHLKLFDPVDQEEKTDTSIVIDRLIDTSIGSFGITTDNKLYCIDDTYYIKALSTREIKENDTIVGYEDDKSYIKLDSSERIDGIYYKKEEPYLSKVIGITETATGIYIIGSTGIYELTSKLTLKTKKYDESFLINDFVRDNVNNKRVVISSNNGTNSNLYKINEVIKAPDCTKLRYKYIDIFNGNYTKYDSSIENYEYNIETDDGCPIIRFDASLYVSLIDNTGSLYNTNDIIEYSDSKYTFGDIDPTIDHEIGFDILVTEDDGTVNTKNIIKQVETKMFILRTNKYGFINYNGFNIENPNNIDNISDINDKKVIRINHKSTDTDITLDDIRQQILKLMYNERSVIKSTVGKTEYYYSSTEPNEKFPIRNVSRVDVGGKISWLDFMNGSLYAIIDGSFNRIVKSEDNYAETEISYNPIKIINDTTLKGFKETSVGNFIWGPSGIMLYNDESSFTNQLVGYDLTTDGNIIDVIDCKDERQSVLIICTMTIYLYVCRSTTGSTFSKPFSLSSNLYNIKNIFSTYSFNRAFIVDGSIYLTSYSSNHLCKLIYSGNNEPTVSIFIANETFTNVVGDSSIGFQTVHSVTKDDKKYLIIYLSKSILSYDLQDNKLELLQSVTGTFLCFDVETDEYIYNGDGISGLYRLNKSTFEVDNVDPLFKGWLFKNANRIYGCNNIDGNDYKTRTIISLFDPNTNRFEPINTYINAEDIDNYLQVDLIRQYKMICGNPNVGVFWTSCSSNTKLNQLIDTSYPYIGRYEFDKYKSISNCVKHKITGKQYYLNLTDSQLYVDGKINTNDLSVTYYNYDKTTDSVPQSGKTYYTISGNFYPIYNIYKFDSNRKYYISNGAYNYILVNKSSVPTPERGKEYFVKNVDGVYVSCGYNFTEFSTNVDYYTRTIGYKLVTETTPKTNVQYYVNENPIYTAITTDISVFDSTMDYYELGTSVKLYCSNDYTHLIMVKDWLIYTITKDAQSFSVAYNVANDTKVVLPYFIIDGYDTNVGIFLTYRKYNDYEYYNIGYFTDDLTDLTYEISSTDVIKDDDKPIKIDLVEFNVDKNLGTNDAQNIFVCGKFGQVYKYSPLVTDSFNKFHSVGSSEFGFNRLINLDSDIFIIEDNSTSLTIDKYDSSTNSIKKCFSGRSFEFVDIGYKTDNDGKKDVYIVGSGDYNIYKSNNNSFIPVFKTFNSSIAKVTKVVDNYSENKIILSLEKKGYSVVIGNDSDSEFEDEICISPTSVEKYNKFIYNSNDYYYTDENGLKYILDNDTTEIKLCNYNMDKSIIGKPVVIKNSTGEFNYYSNDTNVDVKGVHPLDPKINQLPIRSYDQERLIYPCFETDINTLVPTGNVQHLYDSDGITIVHYIPQFDYYVDSEYGTFGIQGDEVYLIKRYTDDNPRWKLINYLKTSGSSFKTIMKTNKLGWILVDDRTITRFNSKTMKFDIEISISEWTNDGVSKIVKINYIEEFVDSDELLIGYIEGAEEINTGVAKPFALQAYRKVGDKYKFVNIIANNSSSSTPITGITETRFGIMVVYNSFPTGTADLTIDSSNFSSFSTKVELIDKNNTTMDTINFMSSAPVNGESSYVWSGLSGSLVPLDLREITETKNGNIVLCQSTFDRDTSNSNLNTEVGAWLLVNSNETTYSSNTDDVFSNKFTNNDDWIFVPLNKNAKSIWTENIATDEFEDEYITDSHYHLNDDGSILCIKNKNSNKFVFDDFKLSCYFTKDNLLNSYHILTQNIFPYKIINGKELIQNTAGNVGITWIQSNITSGNFHCLTTIGNTVIAGSYSNKGLYYSNDNGITWIQSNITSGDFYCLTTIGNTVIAGSYSDKGLYYSNDNGIFGSVKLIKEKNNLYLLEANYDRTNDFIYANLYTVDTSTHSFDFVSNIIIPSSISNISVDTLSQYINYKKVDEEFGLIDFNNQIFIKAFDRVFMIDSLKLTFTTSDVQQFNNQVLYDIRLTIDDKTSWNNLNFKTSNSNIDKFVIKETGIIDLDSYEYNSDTKKLELIDVNKNIINQFFLPHQYYPKDNNITSSYIHQYKECVSNDYLCGHLKHIYNPTKDILLNNSRYMNRNNDNLIDITGIQTNELLGNIEKYIKNLNSYKIDLNIYPTNVENMINNENKDPDLVNM